MIADIVTALKILETIKGIYDQLKENQILLKRLCERVSIFTEILKELETQERFRLNGFTSSRERSVKLLAGLLAEIETFLIDFRESKTMFGSAKNMLFKISCRNQITSDIQSFNQRINDAVYNLMPSLVTDAEQQRRLDAEALKEQVDYVSEEMVNELCAMKGNSEKMMEFIQEIKNDSVDMKTEILKQIVELEKKLASKRALTLKDLGGLEEVLIEEKEEFKLMLEERLTQFSNGLKTIEGLISEMRNHADESEVTILNALTNLEQKVAQQSSISLKELNELKAECKGNHQNLLMELEQKLSSLDLLSVQQDLKEVKQLVSMLQSTSDANNRQLQDQLKVLTEKINANSATAISRKELNEVKMHLSSENQELMKLVEDKLQALDLLSIHKDMKEMKGLLDALKVRSDTKDEKLQQQLMTLEQLLVSGQAINIELLESLKRDLKGENEDIFERITRNIDLKFQSLGNIENIIGKGFADVKGELSAIRKLLEDKYVSKDERKELLKKVVVPMSSRVRFGESQLLGMGGFGNVYLGYYDTTKVALKSLKSMNGNEVEALENEVLIMNYLGVNPSILTCYGIWADQQGVKFIVLEYGPYGSLAELLYDHETFPELPIRLQVGWVLDLINAIAFIHERNVKHKDIKADNLLVFGELKVKLCDFGLSKQQSSAVESSMLGAGTDAFMAPELRTRGSSLASDIYSWAMTFYQIVMRKIPAVTVARVQLIENTITVLQEKLPRVDLTLIKGLLNDCVQENSDRRPTGLYAKGTLSDFLEIIGGDPRLVVADDRIVSVIESTLKEKKKSKILVATPVGSPLPAPSPHSTLISVHSEKLPPDEVTNNDIKVPLRSLNFQEAVELLIHLGCPDNVEQSLLEQGNTEEEFNGSFLYFLETAEELMKECGLQGSSMKLPKIRKIFADLKEVKDHGISNSMRNQLRENKKARLDMVVQRILQRAWQAYNGEEVEMDRKRAEELFREAMDIGCEEGKYWLAILFDEIEETRFLQEAFEWVRVEAERGSPLHMNGLGRCYDKGLGVAANLGKAFEWYLKAAEKGHVNAMNFLGICYNNGKGVAEDKEKAFEWYLKAAEKGQVSAMNNVGWCYQNGLGVSVDKEKAFEWYLKAAEKGHVGAMYNLGECYYYGYGVAEDKEKAFEWYLKAAEKGHVNAMNNVGWCYYNGEGVAIDKVKVFEWYLKAAEKGHVDAMVYLSECYYNGEGVAEDKEKAFEWLLLAAKKGHEGAMRVVSDCYARGIGVAKDVRKSEEWKYKAQSR